MSVSRFFSLNRINIFNESIICRIIILNSDEVHLTLFNFAYSKSISEQEFYDYLFKNIGDDGEQINDIINEIIIIVKLFHYSIIDNSFQDEVFRYNFSSIKFCIIDSLISKFILDLRKTKLKISLSKLSKFDHKFLINSYWEKFISQSLNEDEFNRFSYLAINN